MFLTKIKKNILKVFLFLAFSSFIGLLTNVILARILDKDIFGEYKLFTTIFALLISTNTIGRDSGLLKFLSKNGTEDFNWKKYIYKSILISVVINIVVLTVFYRIYSLSYIVFFVLFLTLFVSNVIGFYSVLLKANEQYFESVLLIKINVFIFFILAFLFYFLEGNLLVLISLFFLSLLINFFLGKIFIFRDLKSGSKEIPKHVETTGIFLWCIGLSFLILTQMDNLFVSKMLGNEFLASYAVLFTFTSLYAIASQAMWSVFLTDFAKRDKVNIKRILLYFLIISTVLTVFYLLFGDILIRFIFNDKYNDIIPFIPYFCIIGVCRIFYTLPASLVGGRSNDKVVKSFFYVTLFGVGLNFILNYFLIIKIGLLGAIVSTIIVWIIRIVFGYALTLKNIDNKIKTS